MACCKVCGVTDDSLFYSSIRTHCKEHWKIKVRQNRLNNIVHYRQYDIARAHESRRLASVRAITKKRRNLIKGRTAAHSAVSRNIRKGLLVRQPCQMCDTELRVHAHHDDYRKPLDVMWLCVIHHKARHAFLDYFGFTFDTEAA